MGHGFGHLRGVELLASHRLRGGDARPLPTPLADAEGLVVVQGDNGVPGDSHLLISFERNQRIARHLPDGRQVARLALPEPLRDPGRYRAPNNGLEAVTLHPRHGLISGPEFAADSGPIPLYASDGTAWYYQPTRPDGGLGGLETLPDGSLLLLERAYSFPLQPWAITLSRARLPVSGDTAPLDAAPVVTFDSADGWRIHNIEAISRHRGSRLFLASDDGGEGLLQTQLIYLELQ